MIDELALGLAPMTVDRLMDIVRRVNADGTTVILVEQSVNRAMHLADHAFFLERGEIRFDGPTAELLDARRPAATGVPGRPGPTGPGVIGLGSPRARVRVPGFVLVQGTITGLSYGLLALGLVLIYRTNRVLNFSQGQLGVVGAVFMVKLLLRLRHQLLGRAGRRPGCWPPRSAPRRELVLRRLFKRPRVLVMVATIGLSQVLFLFTVLPFVRPKKLSEPFPVPFHPSLHPRRLPLRPRPGAHADRGPARRPRPGRCSSGSRRGGWPCGPRPRTPIRPACRACGCGGRRPSPGSSPALLSAVHRHPQRRRARPAA